MSWKLTLSSLILSAICALPASAALIINELDSDSVNTPSTDFAEFIELYDTSGTSVPLDGYVLVYFNGNGNVAYRAEDLDGLVTRPNGYAIIGSIPGAERNVPGNTLQNGGDAVGLYLGNASDWVTVSPGQSPVSATNLIDAVVYKTGADTDGDDMVSTLLVAGGVVDEFGRDGLAATGAIDSIGRLPNASGGLRDTTNWQFMTPTPGGPNEIPEPTTVALLTLSAMLLGCRRWSK